MSDQHNVNSSMERRREERDRQTQKVAEVSQENLQKIATGGLQIWQDYLALGTTLADAWADNLHTIKTSLEQMTNSVKDQAKDQKRAS